MDDANKDIILNRSGTGPGSTPQEPLALVAKMSDSERSALESEGRGLLLSHHGYSATADFTGQTGSRSKRCGLRS